MEHAEWVPGINFVCREQSCVPGSPPIALPERMVPSRFEASHPFDARTADPLGGALRQRCENAVRVGVVWVSQKMIGEDVNLPQPGGFEPARNAASLRPSDFFCYRNLHSQTRGCSSVSELSSSDDAGDRWVGAVLNGVEVSTLVSYRQTTRGRI